MAFKSLIVAHSPDADPEKHRAVIDTGMYKCWILVARDQKQAIPIIKKLVEEERIHSIMLCPGHTHKDIAEIQEIVGGNVGVTVARGDGPSARVVARVMEQEGWFRNIR